MSVRLFAVLLLATATVPARAQDDDNTAIDDTPHITIIGTAQASLPPDLATITLGVVEEKPTARAAVDETARVAQAVVAAAKARGIGASDIATESVTLAQTFDEIADPSGRQTGRKPRGFEATNGMTIEVRDLAKAGDLVQSLIEAGANRFDGIAFSVEHAQPTLDRLTAEAVANARRQAQAVAQAAGVRLGRVLLIERPDASRPSPGPVFVSRMKAASMPVEPGTSALSAQMEVTWAIEP